jgi:uncharacterized protein YggE
MQSYLGHHLDFLKVKGLLMQATTVAAQGEAESTYNLAGFSISLHSLASSVPLAKKKLKTQVDELQSALDAMRQKLSLEFVKNSVRASSSVEEKHEWVKNTNVFKGYEATYSYYFQIDDLEKVSEVYDVLTSLKEVRTQSPHFSLTPKSRDRLNKKALKHAFEKVSERFDTECKVLGLNSADFEIASWEATYSDSQRSSRVSKSMRRMAGARNAGNSADLDLIEAAPVGAAAALGGSVEDDEPLELVVGLATVSANLEVGYARRATEPLKATVVKSATNGRDSVHV